MDDIRKTSFIIYVLLSCSHIHTERNPVDTNHHLFIHPEYQAGRIFLNEELCIICVYIRLGCQFMSMVLHGKASDSSLQGLEPSYYLVKVIGKNGGAASKKKLNELI